MYQQVFFCPETCPKTSSSAAVLKFNLGKLTSICEIIFHVDFDVNGVVGTPTSSLSDRNQAHSPKPRNLDPPTPKPQTPEPHTSSSKVRV